MTVAEMKEHMVPSLYVRVYHFENFSVKIFVRSITICEGVSCCFSS